MKGLLFVSPWQMPNLRATRQTSRQAVCMRRRMDNQGAEYITLESFIKLQGVADTGGRAKMLITDGDVMVNGRVEMRRGKKLRSGDLVDAGGGEMKVVFEEEDVGAQ